MNALKEEEEKQRVKLLYDGNSLNGWAAIHHLDGWLVQNGHLICKGGTNGYLYTSDQYENFILQLEYRTELMVNSGVFFRWSDLNDPVNTGLEMQIWDTYDQDKMVRNSSGALYDLVAPASNAVRPAGEWNQITIKCDRNHIQLTLSEVMVVEADIDQWTVAGKNPDGTQASGTNEAYTRYDNIVTSKFPELRAIDGSTFISDGC